MIGAPFLVFGLLVALSAVFGPQVTGRRRGVVADILLSPLHPATWTAAAAIFVGFWVELLGFLIVIGLLSSGASLLVAGVGFVLVGLGIEGARFVARLERRRAGWVEPAPIRPHAYRPYGSTVRDVILAVFFDLARWRDVVYVLIAFPLAILELAVVVVLWVIAVALLSVPIWYLTDAFPPGTAAFVAASPTAAIAGGVMGLGVSALAATVTRGLMTLHRAVIVGLLCESDRRALEQRVQTLEVSRRAVLDEEASELRGIERDLHDGAQQRLVMLAMQLGLAAERIDEDPAAAKTLVEDARGQARQALAELRDLVRGIAPAILMDRGLVPALSALAGRSPVPTTVSSDLPGGVRLPDGTERAAYYVVAEALANVAKHASAERCEIRCRIEGSRLVVEVEDDGGGGATVVPGGGLAGLANRVEALDGTLVVTSPAGGPTVVRAEIGLPPGAPSAEPPGAAFPAHDPR